MEDSLETITGKAIRGDVDSMMQLGAYFADEQPDVSRRWWKQASQAGDTLAMTIFGQILLSEDSIDEAMGLLLQAAQTSTFAMATCADWMRISGDSIGCDEFILRAAGLGAQVDWQEDSEAGDTEATLRLIRLAAITADKTSFVEASMELGSAWTGEDEFGLHRGALALRSCEPSPWEDGKKPEEIAYLALTIAREIQRRTQDLEISSEDFHDYQMRVLETTECAYSMSEANAVKLVFDEAIPSAVVGFPRVDPES